jgi:hypothetical protein
MSERTKEAIERRERASRGEPEPKPKKQPKTDEPKDEDGGDTEGQS